jgi:cell division protein FtsL
VRKQPAPRAPRRVSGPLRGIERAPRIEPRAGATAGGALAAQAAAFIRALPDHALLDRIVRGRAWIPVLGVTLAGIVAMQVEVLKLESSTGRSMQRTSQLQARNDALRASVATLADDQRIENLAVQMGMVMPPSPEVGFLQAGVQGDAGKALANIHSPDPAAFQSALSSDAAAAQAAAAQSGPPQAVSNGGGPSQTASNDGGSSQASSATTAQSASPQPSNPPGG